MESFLIGLFSVGMGLALTFVGYRVFRVIIPLWGFFGGFSWTAQAMAVGLGTGFLATIFSWIVALAVGVVIGAIAYYYYAFTVGVLAGFIGYWLVGGLMLAIGFNPGFFVTMLATIAGVVLGAAALYYRAPKGLLIVLTALAGATTTIAGLLIMFGQLPVAILGLGLVNEIISYSVGWSLIWIALAAFGLFSQMVTSRDVPMEEVWYSPGDTGTLAGMKGGETKGSVETKNPTKN